MQARAFLAACHAELGMFAAGSSLGEEGLQIAEAVAHPSSLMWAYYGIGLLALRQGALHRALPLLERAMGICQEANLTLFFPRMAAALGAAYTLSGRVAEAVALLTQALEQTSATEMAGFQALCRLPLGEAQMLAGHLAEAHALASGRWRLPVSTRNVATRPMPYASSARLRRGASRRRPGGRSPLPAGPRPG